MKRIFALLITASLLSACGSSSERNSEFKETEMETTASMANLVTMKFEVQGMTCEGCEKAVVSSIGKLPGIEEASASHTEAVSVVVYDTTRTNAEAIAEAIAGAGYQVMGEGSPASTK